MGRDITLLSQFNLMDYSLLFVIEYNPKFAEQNMHLFKKNKEGKLLMPLQPTAQHLDELTSKNIKFNNAKRKKEVSDKFVQKLVANTQNINLSKFENLQNLKALFEQQNMNELSYTEYQKAITNVQSRKSEHLSKYSTMRAPHRDDVKTTNPELW